MTGWLVLALAGTAPAVLAGCLSVAGERILAADLASVIEAFQGAPADTVVALSPAPGSRRVFQAPEIGRLAARLGIPVPETGALCVERAMHPIGRDQVLRAIHEPLRGEAVHLELVDYLKAPVPDGVLEFARASLTRPARGEAVLWHGRLRYAPGRTLSFWAQVRVSVRCRRVFALRRLAAGQPIPEEAIEVREAEVPPSGPRQPSSVDEVKGRFPRKPIPEGYPIEARDLVVPREIETGATVDVEVRRGAARLAFTARAESGGRLGDSILVKNPSTGKRFRAVVEGRNRVTVIEDRRLQTDAQTRSVDPRGARPGSAGASQAP